LFEIVNKFVDGKKKSCNTLKYRDEYIINK